MWWSMWKIEDRQVKLKKIPYGLSDFKRIKTENWYYIDKTKFIETIEEEQSFLFFLRPRRFGKSLLLAMLEAYYDVYYASEFDEIFKETYILDNPTEQKNSYYIMKFDFSAVDITDYKNSFKNHIEIVLKSFILKYSLDFEIDKNNPIDNLEALLNHCKRDKLPLYILIDEYDNFVNKLLVSDMHSYEGLVTDKEAFYKEFFTMLKVGTSGNDSPIRKMFFTGVSPLALFDVTSGSNIGVNVSAKYTLNDVVGVTKTELKEMIAYYGLEAEQEAIIKRCDTWYNSYRFSEDVKHTIYNSDMILYYLKSLIYDHKEPTELIDVNVRTDYSKLKYLVYTNKKLNGNFDLLNQLIQDEHVTLTNIKENFSAFEMLESENFSSFLYALGFVTIEKYRSSLSLKIPNQTIKKIVADFIYSAYKNIDFNIKLQKFNNYLSDFAYEKDLEVFRYLNEEVKAQSCIRDYIDGENFIKGFLVAYFSLNPFYEVKTEFEVTKGFVDILLNPISSEIPYGGVIELKYIAKSKYTEKLKEQKIAEAKEQLQRYDITTVPNLRDKPFVKIVLLYVGWELVWCEELEYKGV